MAMQGTCNYQIYLDVMHMGIRDMRKEELTNRSADADDVSWDQHIRT